MQKEEFCRQMEGRIFRGIQDISAENIRITKSDASASLFVYRYTFVCCLYFVNRYTPLRNPDLFIVTHIFLIRFFPDAGHEIKNPVFRFPVFNGHRLPELPVAVAGDDLRFFFCDPVIFLFKC